MKRLSEMSNARLERTLRWKTPGRFRGSSLPPTAPLGFETTGRSRTNDLDLVGRESNLEENRRSLRSGAILLHQDSGIAGDDGLFIAGDHININRRVGFRNPSLCSIDGIV